MDAFDSSFLTLLFVPNALCSIDRGRERVDFLISDIHGRGDQILIPTPALSELLIGVGHSRSQILHELTKNPKFILGPFDTRAALELSLMTEGTQKHFNSRQTGPIVRHLGEGQIRSTNNSHREGFWSQDCLYGRQRRSQIGPGGGHDGEGRLRPSLALPRSQRPDPFPRVKPCLRDAISKWNEFECKDAAPKHPNQARFPSCGSHVAGRMSEATG